ncbi:DUF488 domain-containing protein [Aeromicrobium choanae]|uniref:Uncharacterized conserved protein YeaO, DUF488 family n=1 Tax=Aeromicrobium choanae TaxID=1736691 RepID=A0A1T4Z3D8_9ACTN|nr:DUF488 family protein [Aeromicrobium choanae]SKB08055.1 Uncharacterized conserved protein YeaO, DUF488 family [Aeromicrobium choanae]
MIRVRRVHDDPSPDDGLRVLVDRLWPRGMTKERAAVDVWLKEVAPSTELRRAFHGGDLDFATFGDRYATELDANPALERLHDLVEEHEVVTLLFAAKDEEHNHALLLRDRLGQSASGR